MTTLTMRDEKRLDVIQRVYRSELTVGQAALVLGLSERQCYRVKARVGKAGAKGVVHGNRGRPCRRKLKDSTVKRVFKISPRQIPRLQRSPSDREAQRTRIDRAEPGESPHILGPRDRFPQEAARAQTPKPQRKTSRRRNDAPGRWLTPRLARRAGAADVSDRRYRRCHQQGDGRIVYPGRKLMGLLHSVL